METAECVHFAAFKPGVTPCNHETWGDAPAHKMHMSRGDVEIAFARYLLCGASVMLRDLGRGHSWASLTGRISKPSHIRVNRLLNSKVHAGEQHDCRARVADFVAGESATHRLRESAIQIQQEAHMYEPALQAFER